MTAHILKFSGTVTGNNSTAPGRSRGGSQVIVVKFTAGITPTVAVAVQGSHDGTNWVTLVFIEEGAAAETKIISVTKTVTGYSFFVISKGWWPYVRVNLSANTNMTLDEAWLLEGTAASNYVIDFTP